MVEISVIVYVNNDEIFLKESMDILVNQTFEDIEIICVDNESDDDSLEILRKYQQKDDRISIQSVKDISMVDAINQILDDVNGKYVHITNPGCILNDDALELLYEKAEETEADLTASDMGYLDEIEDSYYENKCFLDLYEETFDYNDIPNLIDIDVSTENKLYLTSFIHENDLKFKYDEKSFVYESIFKSQKIAYIPFVLCIHKTNYTSLKYRNDSRLLNLIPFSNTLLELFNKYEVEGYKRKLYDHKMYITTEGLKKIQTEYKEVYFNNLRNDFKQIVLKDELYEDFLNNISDYYRKVFEIVIISESYFEYELLKKTFYQMNDYYKLLIDRNYYKKVQEKENKVKNE